jgi:hypothetical protein
MDHKRIRWWVALLLPSLVLRALIPLGFMPMFASGFGVQFVVCESYAPLPGTPASMSMHMHMHAATDVAPGVPDHQDHQDHGTCPYGSGPALGGLPTLAIVLVTVEPAATLAVAAPQVAYFKVPPRAQTSRGPPA